MDGIRRERERLLRQVARAYGSAAVIAAVACLSVPPTLGTTAWLICLPLFALAGAAVWLAGTPLPWIGALGTLVVAIAIAIVLRLVGGDLAPADGVITLVSLTGGAVPAAAITLLSTPRGAIGFITVAGAATTTAAVLLQDAQPPLVTVIGQLFGWSIVATLGVVVVAAVPPAAEQIDSIGRAHRAERQASELEAQRRQGARLLHDTVLATLTLLAHSGVGVNEEVLRTQADSDARLLRQLRLGETPTPTPGTPYAPEPAEDTTLAETLAALRRRFGQMGLEVSLHGAGRVMLPPHVLDAFLLAVAECLENVRRHSGVTVAHVTITEDDRAVRAMVTDAGAGFEVGSVDDGRFGLKESVLGRLASVGGNARIFSSTGAGTTVLLEVPR